MKLKVTVNGIAYSVDVEVEEEQRQLGSIVFGSAAKNLEPSNAKVSGTSLNAVVAPLAGSVFKVLVEEGEAIEAGQVLLVLEAMKMETEITAPNAGTVTQIHVSPGDPVQGGQALVEIE
ncbi:biotin/lipoyl-containing protein [Corynebacterium sp. H128]|uniref:biotin/lipoyl-containing protein n=1 Tax=unclassified Corynebacterium TaxID=2624378 RepID=UPI0030A4A129